MGYVAKEARYQNMKYVRCGSSGLKLPVISVGLWHNFGGESSYENAKDIILGSFDLGITHFDLANNYGPPPGSAEEMFGRILGGNLQAYRDEIIVSTKAGYGMWDGPYGDGGSRKYLMASLEQSLQRMKLDYVDIFYHHRPDSETPLEETMGALASIVHQGKALYVGLSNYQPKELKEASQMLKSMGVKCLIHQHCYSMLNRTNECLHEVIREEEMGSIAFSPLAQGLLTDRYLDGIPKDSRAAGKSVFLGEEAITEEVIQKVKSLHKIAQNRGQTLSQLALVWAIEKGNLTSVIVGASRLEQIEGNVKAIGNMVLTQEELNEIDAILN